MADIRPFAAIRFDTSRADVELSKVIAPPYDVLNEQQKAALQAKHPNNIVNVDLPWMPPKSLGPDSAYEQANITLRSWMGAGIVRKDRRRALYPYTQSFEHHGKTYHRRGFIALVKLSALGPAGGGHVIPHEKTYEGPIEDRLKLMGATGTQLSPIFGLFSDPRSEVTRTLYANTGRPEADGELDGVRHQLWSVIDSEIENKAIDLIGAKPIYIADGHHRYTTALHYQKQLVERNGGKPLPASHPANYCMFVLVSMQDDGLQILPTHRLIGNLSGFDLRRFRELIGDKFSVAETSLDPSQLGRLSSEINAGEPHTFGLYDGTTRKSYMLQLRDLDVLKSLEPERSDAWRRLDVAVLQRYLLEQIIGPTFGKPGEEMTKGYIPDAADIANKVDGKIYQIALLLRPTPLHALEELGKAGDVMPQKSTFFFPKLATGMAMYSLQP